MKKPTPESNSSAYPQTWNRLAGYLEDNNFPAQQLLLDDANDRIEEALENLESL
jgi:hypothetical protein